MLCSCAFRYKQKCSITRNGTNFCYFEKIFGEKLNFFLSDRQLNAPNFPIIVKGYEPRTKKELEYETENQRIQDNRKKKRNPNCFLLRFFWVVMVIPEYYKGGTHTGENNKDRENHRSIAMSDIRFSCLCKNLSYTGGGKNGVYTICKKTEKIPCILWKIAKNLLKIPDFLPYSI